MRASEAHARPARSAAEHSETPRRSRSAFELVEHKLAIDSGAEQDVVHMPVVLAIRRHDRTAKQALLFERREHLVIAAPDRDPLVGDRSACFSWAHRNAAVISLGRNDEPTILPGVFVDLAAEEPAAVGAFLANDLGALRPDRDR